MTTRSSSRLTDATIRSPVIARPLTGSRAIAPIPRTFVKREESLHNEERPKSPRDLTEIIVNGQSVDRNSIQPILPNGTSGPSSDSTEDQSLPEVSSARSSPIIPDQPNTSVPSPDRKREDVSVEDEIRIPPSTPGRMTVTEPIEIQSRPPQTPARTTVSDPPPPTPIRMSVTDHPPTPIRISQVSDVVPQTPSRSQPIEVQSPRNFPPTPTREVSETIRTRTVQPTPSRMVYQQVQVDDPELFSEEFQPQEPPRQEQRQEQRQEKRQEPPRQEQVEEEIQEIKVIAERPKLPRYPDYSHFTVEEKLATRTEFRVKFNILKQAWPSMLFPDIEDSTPLEHIWLEYTRYVQHIHVLNTADTYRKWLSLLFVGIELFITKALGLNAGGYAIAQNKAMTKYESLLIELGEKNCNSSGASWPVEVRLVVMALCNAALLVTANTLSKYIGKELATFLVELVAGSLVPSQPAPGQAAPLGNGQIPDVPSQPNTMGFDIPSLIAQFGGMLGGQVPPNMAQAQQGPPQKRGPRYAE